MKRFLILSSIIFSIFTAQPGFAVVLNNLYVASVPVNSQTVAQRDTSVRDALAQVLVKVSGNRMIATVGAVQNALSDASDYVQGYNYTNSTAFTGPAYILHLRFNEQAIKSLLQKTGQAQWSNERPAIVTYLAWKDGDNAYLIDHHNGEMIISGLERKARERGVVLSIPAFNEDDLQTVSAHDIAQSNLDAITKDSKAYTDKAIFLATFERNDSLSADFTLSFRGEEMTWHDEASTADELVAKAMDQVTDSLAARLAVLNMQHAKQPLQLLVSNISSLEDSLKVSRYLNHLGVVSDVQIVAIEAGKAIYEISLSGSPESLRAAMKLNPTLQPDADAQASAAGTLVYRLAS